MPLLSDGFGVYDLLASSSSHAPMGRRNPPLSQSISVLTAFADDKLPASPAPADAALLASTQAPFCKDYCDVNDGSCVADCGRLAKAANDKITEIKHPASATGKRRSTSSKALEGSSTAFRLESAKQSLCLQYGGDTNAAASKLERCFSIWEAALKRDEEDSLWAKYDNAVAVVRLGEGQKKIAQELQHLVKDEDKGTVTITGSPVTVTAKAEELSVAAVDKCIRLAKNIKLVLTHSMLTEFGLETYFHDMGECTSAGASALSSLFTQDGTDGRFTLTGKVSNIGALDMKATWEPVRDALKALTGASEAAGSAPTDPTAQAELLLHSSNFVTKLGQAFSKFGDPLQASAPKAPQLAVLGSLQSSRRDERRPCWRRVSRALAFL